MNMKTIEADKAVDLQFEIPESLDSEFREIADPLGITPEHLVVKYIRTGLDIYKAVERRGAKLILVQNGTETEIRITPPTLENHLKDLITRVRNRFSK